MKSLYFKLLAKASLNGKPFGRDFKRLSKYIAIQCIRKNRKRGNPERAQLWEKLLKAWT